jgi:hypothetical protein
VRVCGSFDSLRRGLDCLFRESQGSYFRVAQTVVDRNFAQRVPSLLALLDEYGFDALSFIPYFSSTQRKPQFLCLPDIETSVQSLQAKAREKGMEVWRSAIDAGLAEEPDCKLPCATALISVVGSPRGVHPCVIVHRLVVFLRQETDLDLNGRFMSQQWAWNRLSRKN